jgi:hypothetical protein
MFAPINGREWPPFAVGSFVFGWFDFERLLTVKDNPEILGFSLDSSGSSIINAMKIRTALARHAIEKFGAFCVLKQPN